jgi:hypothetical protein
MDHPNLAADLQRLSMRPVGCHANLPGHTGRGEHPLGTGVHQREERGLLGPVLAVGTTSVMFTTGR